MRAYPPLNRHFASKIANQISPGSMCLPLICVWRKNRWRTESLGMSVGCLGKFRNPLRSHAPPPPVFGRLHRNGRLRTIRRDRLQPSRIWRGSSPRSRSPLGPARESDPDPSRAIVAGSARVIPVPRRNADVEDAVTAEQPSAWLEVPTRTSSNSPRPALLESRGAKPLRAISPLSGGPQPDVVECLHDRAAVPARARRCLSRFGTEGSQGETDDRGVDAVCWRSEGRPTFGGYK